MYLISCQFHSQTFPFPQWEGTRSAWLRHPEIGAVRLVTSRAPATRCVVGNLEVGSGAGKSQTPCSLAAMATESGGGGTAGVSTTKADSHVPIFDNTFKSYREYRRRCEVYKQKMELAGRAKETVFNLVTLMTGRAWDLVEDLDVEQLSNEGYQKVFERLDKGFQFDPLTELPGDFEKFFMSLSRKQGQTLQDYTQEFTPAERRLHEDHSSGGLARESPRMVLPSEKWSFEGAEAYGFEFSWTCQAGPRQCAEDDELRHWAGHEVRRVEMDEIQGPSDVQRRDLHIVSMA